jgi:eukaryotic-like serine/threonine-protein kinase
VRPTLPLAAVTRFRSPRRRPLKRNGLVGRMVGNFIVERQLGVGGMGCVYTALHPTLGSRAALKVLHNALSLDRNHVDRFVDEARAAAAVGHPGLVRVFDFGTLPDGRCYSMMEYLEGEDLDHTLRREQRLDPLRVAEIGRQVADALAAAHAGGIVHRDLKPANLFSTRGPDGGERVKILDFGVAKLVGPTLGTPRTCDGMVIGTPQYVSPEQAYGIDDVDGRADVYALGVVLYELCTGRVPFDHKQARQVLKAHAYERPTRVGEHVPGIPWELEAIIMKCLRKRRSARFQSMVELRDALAAFIAAESMPKPTPRRFPSLRVQTLVATLAALALGATTLGATLGLA